MDAIILFIAQSCTHRRPQSLGANYIFENSEFGWEVVMHDIGHKHFKWSWNRTDV